MLCHFFFSSFLSFVMGEGDLYGQNTADPGGGTHFSEGVAQEMMENIVMEYECGSPCPLCC